MIWIIINLSMYVGWFEYLKKGIAYIFKYFKISNSMSKCLIESICTKRESLLIITKNAIKWTRSIRTKCADIFHIVVIFLYVFHLNHSDLSKWCTNVQIFQSLISTHYFTLRTEILTARNMFPTFSDFLGILLDRTYKIDAPQNNVLCIWNCSPEKSFFPLLRYYCSITLLHDFYFPLNSSKWSSIVILLK